MIDWDFPAIAEGGSGALHWYPGTFTPALPATLIQALTKPGDLVVDPYAGIGTVGVEAIRSGRNALLFELNPIARAAAVVACGLASIARSNRTTASNLLTGLRNEVERVLSAKGSIKGLFDGDGSASSDLLPDLQATEMLKELSSRRIARGELARWIAPRTLKSIVRVLEKTHDSLGPFARLCLWVMMSDRLRSLSSQVRSWGHVADRVLPKADEFVEKDVVAAARRWVATARGVVDRMAFGSAPQLVESTVAAIDWSTTPSHGMVDAAADLLLTSPPYGGAIDYVRSQRLSLHLAGYSSEEIETLGRQEIGARRKRFSQAGRESWIPEISGALDQQLGMVGPQGAAVFVLPTDDSSREEAVVDLLGGVESRGWKRSFEAIRSIRSVRARQNWTSIKREIVVVFTRKDE